MSTLLYIERKLFNGNIISYIHNYQNKVESQRGNNSLVDVMDFNQISDYQKDFNPIVKDAETSNILILSYYP